MDMICLLKGKETPSPYKVEGQMLTSAVVLIKKAACMVIILLYT